MAESSQTAEANAIELRNNLLVYILNNAATKLPMKQSDMVEVLGKKYSRKLKVILAEVVEILKNVYGIVMKEVAEEKSSAKKFICYAEDNIESTHGLLDHQKREITLLFIILSYIFMMGGSVYEEQLQHFLEGLKIEYAEEHYYFGSNLKKLISETFVKQLYLKRKKSEAELDVDLRYTLSWGFRAQKEFSKKHVLNIAAELMNCEPESFQLQYLKASEEKDEGDEDVTIVE